MTDDREKLENEVFSKFAYVGAGLHEEIVKFILADRRRVVMPLLDYKIQAGGDFEDANDAIDGTLRNAGVPIY